MAPGRGQHRFVVAGVAQLSGGDGGAVVQRHRAFRVPGLHPVPPVVQRVGQRHPRHVHALHRRALVEGLLVHHFPHPQEFAVLAVNPQAQRQQHRDGDGQAGVQRAEQRRGPPGRRAAGRTLRFVAPRSRNRSSACSARCGRCGFLRFAALATGLRLTMAFGPSSPSRLLAGRFFSPPSALLAGFRSARSAVPARVPGLSRRMWRRPAACLPSAEAASAGLPSAEAFFAGLRLRCGAAPSGFPLLRPWRFFASALGFATFAPGAFRRACLFRPGHWARADYPDGCAALPHGLCAARCGLLFLTSIDSLHRFLSLLSCP